MQQQDKSVSVVSRNRHVRNELEVMSDENLMEQFQQGVVKAFDILVERYSNHITFYLNRFLRDKRRSEDLLQETWLRVHRNRHSYNNCLLNGQASKFSTWLYTIAGNLARTEYRKRQRRGERSLYSLQEEEEREDLLFDVEHVPDQKTELAFRRESVQTALSDLEPLYREVIVLRFMQELSYVEIEAITGLPMGTVKSRMYRGLVRLGKALEPILEEGRSVRVGGVGQTTETSSSQLTSRLMRKLQRIRANKKRALRTTTHPTLHAGDVMFANSQKVSTSLGIQKKLVSSFGEQFAPGSKRGDPNVLGFDPRIKSFLSRIRKAAEGTELAGVNFHECMRYFLTLNKHWDKKPHQSQTGLNFREARALAFALFHFLHSLSGKVIDLGTAAFLEELSSMLKTPLEVIAKESGLTDDSSPKPHEESAGEAQEKGNPVPQRLPVDTSLIERFLGVVGQGWKTNPTGEFSAWISEVEKLLDKNLQPEVSRPRLRMMVVSYVRGVIWDPVGEELAKETGSRKAWEIFNTAQVLMKFVLPEETYSDAEEKIHDSLLRKIYPHSSDKKPPLREMFVQGGLARVLAEAEEEKSVPQEESVVKETVVSLPPAQEELKSPVRPKVVLPTQRHKKGEKILEERVADALVSYALEHPEKAVLRDDGRLEVWNRPELDDYVVEKMGLEDRRLKTVFSISKKKGWEIGQLPRGIHAEEIRERALRSGGRFPVIIPLTATQRIQLSRGLASLSDVPQVGGDGEVGADELLGPVEPVAEGVVQEVREEMTGHANGQVAVKSQTAPVPSQRQLSLVVGTAQVTTFLQSGEFEKAAMEIVNAFIGVPQLPADAHPAVAEVYNVLLKETLEALEGYVQCVELVRMALSYAHNGAEEISQKQSNALSSLRRFVKATEKTKMRPG